MKDKGKIQAMDSSSLAAHTRPTIHWPALCSHTHNAHTQCSRTHNETNLTVLVIIATGHHGPNGIIHYSHNINIKVLQDKRGTLTFHCYRKTTDVKIKSNKTHGSSAGLGLELEVGSRSSLTTASHFPPHWSSSQRLPHSRPAV